MEVRRVQDPRAFASETRTLLLADEARHNLILGITTTLMDQPEVYREFHLWVAERNGEVEGCAVMTPPFNLVVSRPRHEDVLSALAHTLYRDRLKVPGVTGAIPEVEQFASAWRQVAGVGTAVEMRQRIYELRSVRTVPEPSGGMRDATASDRSLLLDWILSFARDAHLREGGHPDQVERIVDARLSNPKEGYVLWEDGEAVSLVGYGGSTPSGIRIGPVYTPAEHRRTRLRDRPHGQDQQSAPGQWSAVVLPLHRCGESDLQPDLRAHRLRTGVRFTGNPVHLGPQADCIPSRHREPLQDQCANNQLVMRSDRHKPVRAGAR